MSRSYLRDKHMKSVYTRVKRRNMHNLDEIDKNRPNKDILKYVDISKVEYCTTTPSGSGHSRTSGGRRMISGIVRAGRKAETRKLIDEQIIDASNN